MTELEPLIDVTGVRLLARYVVELTFADGHVRVMDLESLLWGPMFEPLKDPSFSYPMFEQMRDRLIERINAAFGYRAVSEVRVIQAPLPKRVQPSHQRIPADRAENPSLSNLADGPLKQAFARMATGIKLRREAKDAATA